MKKLKNNYINREKAWKHFESLGYTRKGSVLHHKDINLKINDPIRYNQWRISDLIPMTRQEHRRLHMKIQSTSTKRTKEHNNKIKKGLSEHSTFGKLVQITKDDTILVFDSFADAAIYIGCTRQLVSQCTRKCQRNKRAMGYKITLIDKNTD